MASEWYAEGALAELLTAMRAELTDGSRAEFVQLIEAIALEGVGRFFRLVLSLASPRFVLRKIPVIWGRMRRGGSHVEVVVAADHVELHYRDFPRFDDENYRLMALGTLGAMCRAAGSQTPRVEIVGWTRDSLDVNVRA